MPEPGVTVTDTKSLAVETFEWGTIQWLSSDSLSPGAQQTVGICKILPGKQNPRHLHPNCEEVLHMLAGCGRHTVANDFVELHAGATIRIPKGVKHNLINTDSEPITCLIVFSSGQRKTVPVA